MGDLGSVAAESNDAERRIDWTHPLSKLKRKNPSPAFLLLLLF